MHMETPDELKAEILRLNDKITVMRKILWEWNPSSRPIWENPRLQNVGEKDIDYSFLVNEDEGPDMPLFDFGN